MDNLNKNRVLLVDDDVANIMQLIHILKADYKLNVAKDGASAIQHAQEHLPDLILLDIVMPDMDGFEVLSELQKSEDTAKIPVIFITALSNSGDGKKWLSLGAADYICKPFDDVIVRQKVAGACCG